MTLDMLAPAVLSPATETCAPGMQGECCDDDDYLIIISLDHVQCHLHIIYTKHLVSRSMHGAYLMVRMLGWLWQELLAGCPSGGAAALGELPTPPSAAR